MNNSKVLDLGKRILAPLPLELDHKLSLYRICVLLLTFFCCSALPGMLSSTNKRDSKLKLATMIHRAGRELHQLFGGENFPTDALFGADERVGRLIDLS